MFTAEFYGSLLLTIVALGLGGLALWTWQIRPMISIKAKGEMLPMMLREAFDTSNLDESLIIALKFRKYTKKKKITEKEE